MRRTSPPLLALVWLLLAEAPASAYTDPGSGALVWQMAVAGFVGVVFYFRGFLNWLKGRVKSPKK